jgi:regulator of protease activity HflC (stomatin/prohibitin superfamily)
MPPEERAVSHATTHEGRYGADFATQQRPARVLPGGLVLAAIVAVLVAGAAALVLLDATVPLVAGALLEVGAASLLAGLFVVAPNEAMVLVLFGRYVGTVDRPGFYWANPFTALWRETISLRVRNFQSERTKVNDASGSPIEIAAVIVWRVVDTARAVFDVEDFREFVVVQGETAIRHLATQYPYDDFDGLGPSLRANADAVSRTLHAELQDRLAAAGIEVLEARLTHLAYAPEIAEAMLRRQQASAIVAARRTIVHGAVGLVEMALREIAQEGIVELDEERRAAMVSNLMVVLTGDRAPTPVINAGTLYS